MGVDEPLAAAEPGSDPDLGSQQPPIAAPAAMRDAPAPVRLDGGSAGPVAFADARHTEPSQLANRASPRGGDSVAWASAVANECSDLEALCRAVDTFEGCALRATATRLCFADGPPDASLMLIGEAPGAEEDRQGRPFVGQSGQLLDRILAAAGLERRAVYLTNCIFWRPPGNRPPTTAEIAVCQPFLERQIELLRPRMLLFLGGTAARVLLGIEEGVMRLRGRRLRYKTAAGLDIPARVTFHPAYLLRQPLQKKFVWRDLLDLTIELARLAAADPAP